MAVVWKYVLAPVPEQTINIPVGAQLLHVAEQNGQLCLWAKVDLSGAVVSRRFYVAATGYEMPSYVEHIGTALMQGGDLVFHVFEDVPF
jgi:hypothetical protein